MRKTVTETLLDKLNNLDGGKKYPMKGYRYFADIKGDGRNIRSVYVIINDAGGVVYSGLNGATPAERVKNIRAAIARHEARS